MREKRGTTGGEEDEDGINGRRLNTVEGTATTVESGGGWNSGSGGNGGNGSSGGSGGSGGCKQRQAARPWQAGR